MSSTSCNLDGNCHAEVPKKVERLNGTTTLSLGEVAKLDSEFSHQSLDHIHIYHEQNQGTHDHLPFAALIEEKQSYYHHHQNTTFGTSSSSSNKGQALFQVDFM